MIQEMQNLFEKFDTKMQLMMKLFYSENLRNVELYHTKHES